MKPTEYETALWGFSWEEALGDDAQQGIANLSEDNGITLEIPFGSIDHEDENSCVIRFADVTKQYPALFGISRTNDYLALQDVQSNGVSWSFPGGKKETLRAAWLFAARQWLLMR